MKGEMINLYIGQCGVQMSNACWELFCLEHGVMPDGHPQVHQSNEQRLNEDKDHSYNCFFHQTSDDHFTPRTMLVDTEPTVIDEIRVGVYRNLFNPASLISGLEDAANNFGRGYHLMSQRYMEFVEESIRQQVEACELIKGFCAYHAYGGGTGTGLVAALFQEMEIKYPKQTIIDFGLYPSRRLGTCMTEPYNNVLACTHPARSQIMAIIFDNEALIRVLNNFVQLKHIPFNQINRFLAQVVSGLTASLRYSSSLQAKIIDLQTNLVPYPSMQYLLVSAAPLLNANSVDTKVNTLNVITSNVFRNDYQLATSDISISDSVFMACGMLYRGDIAINGVNSAIEQLKKDSQSQWTDWIPTGFKIGVTNHPMTTVKASGLAASLRSVIALHNSTMVKGIFSRQQTGYRNMLKKRAFLHWYLHEGMEEAEFHEAYNRYSTLIEDYHMVDSCHKNESLQHPGDKYGGTAPQKSPMQKRTIPSKQAKNAIIQNSPLKNNNDASNNMQSEQQSKNVCEKSIYQSLPLSHCRTPSAASKFGHGDHVNLKSSTPIFDFKKFPKDTINEQLLFQAIDPNSVFLLKPPELVYGKNVSPIIVARGCITPSELPEDGAKTIKKLSIRGHNNSPEPMDNRRSSSHSTLMPYMSSNTDDILKQHLKEKQDLQCAVTTSLSSTVTEQLIPKQLYYGPLSIASTLLSVTPIDTDIVKQQQKQKSAFTKKTLSDKLPQKMTRRDSSSDALSNSWETVEPESTHSITDNSNEQADTGLESDYDSQLSDINEVSSEEET